MRGKADLSGLLAHDLGGDPGRVCHAFGSIGAFTRKCTVRQQFSMRLNRVCAQGNRVKDLRGDDAGEKVIVPGRDLAA